MQSEIEAASVLLPEGGDSGRSRRREGNNNNNNNSGVMKKYSKLLLGLLAAVSSLCFLVYKYRYDRLYHVMQVLEVFGSPEEGTQQSPGRSLTLSPGWLAVGGGVWLYSAYCGGPQCKQVTVLGLVEREHNTAVAADLQCALWFEGSRHHLEGLVSVASDDFRVSTFTCESKYPEKTPYAVAIYKGKAPEHRIQIQHGSEVGTKSVLNICVLPASLQEGDVSKMLVESLVLHSLLQVDTVTFYSSALPASLLSTAEKLMRDTGIVVEANTWSNPLRLNSSVIGNLLSKDCYYRSKDKFNNFVVLNSHQVLLPRTKTTIKETFEELSKAGALKRGPNKLQVNKFCSEYPTEKKAKNIEVPITVLEYTYYNKQLSQDSVTIVSLSSSDSDSDVASKSVPDILSINDYRDCDNYDLKETDENAIYDPNSLRFFSELVKHYIKYV